MEKVKKLGFPALALALLCGISAFAQETTADDAEQLPPPPPPPPF